MNKCKLCLLFYDHNIEGQNCENKYCTNRNICETCSIEIGLSLYSKKCNMCIKYGDPSCLEGWIRYFIITYF